MATLIKFEDVYAWQKARVFSKEIFILSNETALNKDFRFPDQINAAVDIVIDNIAEGFERGGRFELVNFHTVAKGSCAEVRSQLYRVFDQQYIIEDKFGELLKLGGDIGNMLGSWIKYLNETEQKGTKFKNRSGK